MSAVELRSGSRTVEARADSDGAMRIGSVRYTVEPAGDGFYRVSDGVRQWVIATAGAGDERWVFVGGQIDRIEIDDAGARQRSRTSGHELSSPMPATVVRIHVEPGTAVGRGDVLLTLEAMKMELAIRAPRDGVVAAINCTTGDLVPPGVNLIELT